MPSVFGSIGKLWRSEQSGSSWLSSQRSKDGFEPPSRSGRMLGWLRDIVGGYPGPEISQDDEYEVSRELKREKVHAGPTSVLLPWFLPYPDEITGETATIRRFYRRMMAEPNIKAALLHKIFSVAALDVQVLPDGEGPKAKRVADFVKWNLTRRVKGGFRKVIESLALGGCIDGYSVSEKVFAPQESGEWAGKWALKALKAKDVGNDVALVTDEYRNIVSVMGLKYNAGQCFSPSNFVILQFLSLFETPTGMSDFRAVYSRYWLLDTTLKLRAMGLEKRAWPIIKGTYASSTQKPSLEEALRRAKSTSWISVPAGAQVEALEIAGRSQDEFANAIKDLKHDIFMGLAGAVLQALEGTMTNARGNSLVHKDTASLFIWYLASLCQTAINDEECGVVPDLVDLNFSGAGYPLVTCASVDPEQIAAEIKNAKGLHDIGMDLSKKELYTRTGYSPPSDEADTLKGAPPKPQTGETEGNFPNSGNALAEDASVNALTATSRPGSGDKPFRGFAEGWKRYLNGRKAS